MNQNAIIKRLNNLEAIGRMVTDEAIKLRESLGHVNGRASRKGLSEADRIKVLARRNKTAFKK